MSTELKYYLPPGGSPPHSPSFAPEFSSYYSSAYKYPLVTSKSSTAHAEKNGAILSIGTETVAAALWVSPALDAHEWTSADAIEFVGSCRANGNVTAGYVYIVVRLMNADCSLSRGTLYAGAGPTALGTGWPGPSRALAAGGGHVHVQNAVSGQAGDHLVVDVGFTITGSAQYAACTFYTGDENASDLPMDETTNSISYDPYIKFTLEDAVEEHSGSASISGSGTVAGTGRKQASGAASVSAVGAIATLGVAAMLGLAAITGGVGISTAGHKTASAAASASATPGIAASGQKQASAISSVSAGMGVSSSGQKAAYGSSVVSGSGGIEATGVAEAGEETASGSATISSGGGITTTGSKAALGASSLSGVGSISSAGQKAAYGVAVVSGIGNVEATGQEFTEVDESTLFRLRARPRIVGVESQQQDRTAHLKTWPRVVAITEQSTSRVANLKAWPRIARSGG